MQEAKTFANNNNSSGVDNDAKNSPSTIWSLEGMGTWRSSSLETKSNSTTSSPNTIRRLEGMGSWRSSSLEAKSNYTTSTPNMETKSNYTTFTSTSMEMKNTN